MSSVRKSLALSFAEKYSAIFIQFGATIILARLLTPKQIGVFTVGVALISLVHTFRDFGVSNYLIQETSLTDAKVRTAFGVTLVVGVSIAALLWLASDPIADFYAEPGVRQVVQVLATNFLLIPFGSVTLALLRRELNFAALYWINTVSNIVQVTVSIGLALAGFGFMSLAWSALAGILATVGLAFWYLPRTTVLLPSFEEFHSVFSFGVKSSAASFFFELGYSAPDLVIGRVFGFEVAGLFSRAMGLALLFNRMVTDAVQVVALPFFAAERRAKNDRLKDAYFRTLSYLLGLAWPFYTFVALMAFPIVYNLYGPQWTGAVPILRILCGSLALGLIPTVSSMLLMSMGAVGENMRARACWDLTKIFLVILASFSGITAVAACIGVANLVGFWIYHVFVRQGLGLELGAYARVLSENALLAATTGFVPLLVLIFADSSGSPWVSLMLAAAGSAIVWLLGLHILRHPLVTELQLLRQQLFSSIHRQRMDT